MPTTSAPRRDFVMTPSEWRPSTDGPPLLIVTLLRPRGGTGVHTYFQGLGRCLANSGDRYHILTPFSIRFKPILVVFAVRYVLQRFSPGLGVWWYIRWHTLILRWVLWAHLRKAGDEPVLIFAQCPSSARAALRVRRSQDGVVCAVHFNVSQAEEWVEKGNLEADSNTYRWITRNEEASLRAVDGLVFISDFMRRTLMERYPSLACQRALVCPPLLRFGELTPHESRGDLVTVGSLEPRKNHSYLLDVLAECQRRGYTFSLTVIGDGPTRNALVLKSAQLGLAHQVRFLGFREDARAYMPGHLAYIHTSWMESFGIVLLEAMSCGLPVLAAEVGGIPEVLEEPEVGRFIPLGNASRAAEVVISLLDDPAEAAATGERAKEYVRRKFCATVWSSRLTAFLRSCLPS